MSMLRTAAWPRVTETDDRVPRWRFGLVQLCFGTAALAACVLAPLIGTTPIDLRQVFDPSIPFSDNVDAQIFFLARLPRTLAGALVGAALASAGVVLQALLRNPLATPFTLGVSAGASLAASGAASGAALAAAALPWPLPTRRSLMRAALPLFSRRS